MNKKEFQSKYPGYINLLNNIFGSLKLSKSFFGDEIELGKKYYLENNKLIINFKLYDNYRKFSKIIDKEFDFDFYLSNSYLAKKNKIIDFNKVVNFNHFNGAEVEYIEYLNDFNIKKHLFSKYDNSKNIGSSHIADVISSGMGIIDTNRLRRNSGTYEYDPKDVLSKLNRGVNIEDILKESPDHLDRLITGKNEWLNSIFSSSNKVKFIQDIKSIDNTTTIYEILGKPKGKVYFNYRSVPNNVTDFGSYSSMKSNPNIFFDYNQKANHILKIEIIHHNKIFYKELLLLDSKEKNEISLNDYETIEKNINEYLISFQNSKQHGILSKNLGISSLIEFLTGKNFKNKTPIISDPIIESKNIIDRKKSDNINNLNTDELISVVYKFITEKYIESFKVFENKDYNLIDGFLSPIDHLILKNQCDFVKLKLKEILPSLLKELKADTDTKWLLETSWETMISETEKIFLEKYLNYKKIKLANFDNTNITKKK